MSPASAAARIADLRRRIDDADHRYYMLDAPDIPDVVPIPEAAASWLERS